MRVHSLLVVVLSVLFLSPAVRSEEKVTDLKGFWREGQTFLTWKELTAIKKEQYNIYQATTAITADNLARATKIATVSEGTCHNYQVLRKRRKKMKLDPTAEDIEVNGYAPRYSIVDNVDNDPRKVLAYGTGLFVNTTHKERKYFYAVVPVVEGKEQATGLAALTEGIDEKVMLPGAVIQWKHPEGTAAIYCHWMDHSKWDPFNETNAYSFGVAVPKKYDGKSVLPINYWGHGMGGGYRVHPTALYMNALWIWLGDESGSWWYGVMNKEKTKVINYAEQRIRWSYEWVCAGRPNQFFKVNPRLVLGHGHSMGGTMMTACALRMGDIFGFTVSSCGATIHSRNGPWVRQASKLWGTTTQNLPTPDGTGVWDHQDYGKWGLKHITQDSSFLLLNNGQRDGSVVFEPFPDFVDALQKAKRPFAACWSQKGHMWSAYHTRNARWQRPQIPNNETLPAFSNASNNDDPRKTKSGQINGKLEWCASGNNFDKAGKADDIVDTEAEWGMNIRALGGPATVDVTPRKVQKFKVEKGKAYRWENFDFSDPRNPKKVAEGTVNPDEHGLITVVKFKVGHTGLGNRLVIRSAAEVAEKPAK